MTAFLLSVVALVLLSLGLTPAGPACQRATPEELAAARLVAAARLRRLAEEREERLRQYARAWSVARRPVPAHGYVIEFHARGRRG
jgi:aryl-alcohol dehydrogenase-like predicted oxidoreductase